MRLLFVAPYVPLATKPRPYRFIEHLSRSHEIHLVAFDIAPDARYQEREDFQRLKRLCASVTLLPLPRWQRYADVLLSIPSSTPARVAYYGRGRLDDHIAHLAETFQVDAIHVDRLRLAPLCDAVGLPKVVDATDCISEYLSQCVPHISPLIRPAYAYEAAKTRVYERRAALAYDQCLVTTKREAELYANTGYAERVRVVPNILDASLFDEGRVLQQHRDPVVLFAGNLNYLPNVDAAHYLIKRIWPLIRRQVPEARLVLAGATPHPSVRRAARAAGVELTGFVPNLADLMALATVTISPMRIGVGFPNKVAEAMAQGQAVVSTSVGCRGLGDCASAVSVADDAHSFAQSVVDLLNDSNRRAELGQCAREYAFRSFHPSVVTAQLDHVFKSLTHRIPVAIASDKRSQ
jgi:polysaccharide biosynthesis protein PslH